MSTIWPGLAASSVVLGLCVGCSSNLLVKPTHVRKARAEVASGANHGEPIFIPATHWKTDAPRAVNVARIEEQRVPEGDEAYGVTVSNPRGLCLATGIPSLVVGVGLLVYGMVWGGDFTALPECSDDDCGDRDAAIRLISAGSVLVVAGTSLTVVGGLLDPSMRAFPSAGYTDAAPSSSVQERRFGLAIRGWL